MGFVRPIFDGRWASCKLFILIRHLIWGGVGQWPGRFLGMIGHITRSVGIITHLHLTNSPCVEDAICQMVTFRLKNH